MDKKDWEEIVYKCAEDYKAAKSFDGEGIKTPPRDFIRAWMQINYKIFKLSGYFYRLFNRLVIQENRMKTHTDNISESIGEKINTASDSDSLKKADILMSVEEINGLIKKYGQPMYPETDGYSWFEFFDYTAFYDVPIRQAMFVDYKGEKLAVSSLEWNFRKAQTYVGLKHYGVDGQLFYFDEENGDEIKISIKRFAHLFPQQYLKLLDIISDYDEMNESIGDRITTVSDEDILQNATITLSHKDIRRIIIEQGDMIDNDDFEDYELFLDDNVFVNIDGGELAVRSLTLTINEDGEEEDPQVIVSPYTKFEDGYVELSDQEDYINIFEFQRKYPRAYQRILFCIEKYDLNESIGEKIENTDNNDIIKNAKIGLTYERIREMIKKYGDKIDLSNRDYDWNDFYPNMKGYYGISKKDAIIVPMKYRNLLLSSLMTSDGSEDDPFEIDPHVVLSTYSDDGFIHHEDDETSMNIDDFKRAYPDEYERLIDFLERYDLNESVGERIASHSDEDISDKARITLSYDDIWDIVKKYGIDDFWANIHQYDFYRFYPNTDKGYGCYPKDAIFVNVGSYYKKLFLKSLRTEEGVGDDSYKTNVDVILGEYFVDGNGIVQGQEDVTTLNIRDFHKDYPNEYNTLLGYLTRLSVNESIGERIEHSSEDSDLSKQATRQIEDGIEDGFFTLLKNHFGKYKEEITARAKANGLGFSFIDDTKEKTAKLARGGSMTWESKYLKFFLNYNKDKIDKKTNKIVKQFLGMMEIHIMNDINNRDIYQFKVYVKEPFSYMSSSFRENWDTFNFVSDSHQKAAFEKFITPPILSFSASAWQPTMRNAHLFIDIIELIVDHFKEINEELNQYPNKGISQHVKEIFNEIKEEYYNDSADSVYN